MFMCEPCSLISWYSGRSCCIWKPSYLASTNALVSSMSTSWNLSSCWIIFTKDVTTQSLLEICQSSQMPSWTVIWISGPLYKRCHGNIKFGLWLAVIGCDMYMWLHIAFWLEDPAGRYKVKPFQLFFLYRPVPGFVSPCLMAFPKQYYFLLCNWVYLSVQENIVLPLCRFTSIGPIMLEIDDKTVYQPHTTWHHVHIYSSKTLKIYSNQQVLHQTTI